MKRFISLLFLGALLFTTSLTIKAVGVEVPLYSTKTGVPSKVYHYGTNQEVTLPKDYIVNEAEMRGVWVATVYNIAIEKQHGTSQNAIDNWKKEFLKILDTMESYGMNTLYFQIRPANDAFYQSSLNSWSEFLVGPGIDPGWDPLEWMIAETHQRGFSFQGWMNAFRVTTESILPEKRNASYYSNSEVLAYKNAALAKLADDNFAKLHPEYVLVGESDTRLILNPSEPAVQQFIVDTIEEIVTNYDIDGLHFDDYFYLNGATSSDTVNTNFAGGTSYNNSYIGSNILNDIVNYQEYQNGNSKYSTMEEGYTLGDFRRENINIMMRNIRKMIDNYNRIYNDDVEYGSKPAAVWRSNIEYCAVNEYRCVENGSNTHANAYSTYMDLFADSLQWVKEGLVDYVAPQVYYSFEDSYAKYADVVDWWVEQVDAVNQARKANGQKEIKLYIAHGIYKYRDNPEQFYTASEVRNQLYYNKKYDTIKGSAFYSYENLVKFTSTNHEKAMAQVKKLWTENPVYPISKGEDKSQNLLIDDYTVRQNQLNNKTTINFNLIEGAKVYGLYQVNKSQLFDPSDVSTRKAVLYAPYQKGQTGTFTIDQYSFEFDYYIKAVSDNGYLSPLALKVDFDNAITYQSIVINEVSEVKSKLIHGEKALVNVSVTYLDTDKLNYEVYYIENTTRRQVVSGAITSDTFSFTFEAYGYVVDEAKLEIVVKDSNAAATKYTNIFSIVSEIEDPDDPDTPPKQLCPSNQSAGIIFAWISSISLIVFLFRKNK